MIRPALLTLVLASPVLAEPPLSAAEFEALTLGRTMTWAEFGQVYGVEQYLEDRHVRWTVLGGDCVAGHWYPAGDAICFVYENGPETHCWTITLEGPGMLAIATDDPTGTEPVTIAPTTETMPCFGPEVGA
jgi:hypothetical protein